MSHTHLLFHVVFATKNRAPIITADWRSNLHRFLAATINALEGKAIEVGGVADHVHLFVRLKPTIALSDFLRELKSKSSAWAKRQFCPDFTWQSRYGAFTVSESQAEIVRKYIREQEQHHAKRNLDDEYVALLKAHKVEFDERFPWS